MIEQPLYEHLQASEVLKPYMAVYSDKMAIFSQEAPADSDPLWRQGPQYGRIVFAVDIEGDPERTMGGTLTVDVMCKEGDQFPEELEPIVRPMIDGYFFSSGTFTVSAQWKTSDYFTQPNDHVIGVTLSFSLLAFPRLTTIEPDVIERLNEWTSHQFPDLHVINYAPLPGTWKPGENEAAIYWRVVRIQDAKWIPNTYQTIWRTATIRGHVFASNLSTIVSISRNVINALYAKKRLTRDGESQIMTNTSNTLDVGADALRTGQITVEGTYGVIVYHVPDNPLNHINVD